MSAARKICIATSTRADWGLLQPLAERLKAEPGVDLRILATNMHLMEKYGATASEIETAGFAIDERVPMPDAGSDSPGACALAAAACLDGTARALERMRPDAIVILGDRYEMLAVATAAALMHTPIVHISGGEVTEGAIDDSLRHAITKLATLHLTATEPYRRRVIQMGEQPELVVNVGSLGVWNAFNRQLPTPAEVLESLDIAGSPDIALVTYHPATLDPEDPGVRFDALTEALDRFPQLHVIVTYPNSDPRSATVIDRIAAWCRRLPERVTAVKSLGMKRYLTASAMARVVIGNSSSGVIEVPSAGTPTVDIGIRQKGRLAARSVIHCGDSADDIAAAIAEALSPEMQQLAAKRDNPYARPDTVELAARAIIEFVNTSDHAPKRFYDLPC